MSLLVSRRWTGSESGDNLTGNAQLHNDLAFNAGEAGLADQPGELQRAAAGAGQRAERIGSLPCANQRPAGTVDAFGQADQGQAAARAQQTAETVQPGRDLAGGDQVEHIQAAQPVEAGRGKGQPFAIGLAERGAAFVAGRAQHGQREIDAESCPAGSQRRLQSLLVAPGAQADVQQAQSGLQVQVFEQAVFGLRFKSSKPIVARAQPVVQPAGLSAGKRFFAHRQFKLSIISKWVYGANWTGKIEIMRPEPQQDLAPDLEWMLQSSQASRELLLEALVEEYYAPALQLARAALLDETAARAAAAAALAEALGRAHAYRGKLGVEEWLLGMVVDACLRRTRRPAGWALPERETAELDPGWPAFASLTVKRRITAALAYLRDWPTEQIARCLSQSEKRVRHNLQLFDARFAGDGPPGWALPAGAAEDTALRQQILPARLRGWFRGRFPLPAISDDERTELGHTVAALAARQGRQRRMGWLAAEVLAVLLAVLAAAGSIWGVNQVLPDEAETPPPLRVTELVYVTSTPAEVYRLELSPTPSPTLANAYVIVRPSDTLYSIAQRLDVSVAELSALNRLARGARLEVGQRLLNPKRWPAPGEITATPVPPHAPPPVLPEPVDVGDLLRRMGGRNESYHTLWFDARLVVYGPEGYIGPARVHRVQAWLGEDQSLMLIGGLDGEMEEVWLRQGERVQLARPDSVEPWSFDRQGSRMRTQSTQRAGEVLRQMAGAVLSLNQFPATANLRVAGRDEQAGQPALRVEQLDASGEITARYWLDDRTGLVLRKTVFGDNFPSIEIILDQVAYNVDIPQALLDTRLPWRGGFAASPGGNPEAYSPVRTPPARRNRGDYFFGQGLPPPEGFDPAGSALVFEYSSGFDPQDAFGSVNLYASGPLPTVAPRATPGAQDNWPTAYALGGVVMGDPWQLACARSPDGRWIAYVNRPQIGPYPESLLNWFHLGQKIEKTTTVYRQMGVTDFAFSPDSRALAFFGQVNPAGAGTLYVQELYKDDAQGVTYVQSGPLRELMQLRVARSLAWSPDGRSLALLARLEPDSEAEMLLVIDVQSGAIRYHEPYDPQTGAKLDWLTGEWEVEFPVEMGGLEACTGLPER